MINGPDPALFIAGFEYLPEGASEFAFAGAIKGQPIDVMAGPLTGLPAPARAEIILEGHMHPGETLPEGSFVTCSADNTVRFWNLGAGCDARASLVLC